MNESRLPSHREYAEFAKLGDALAWACADLPTHGPNDLPECGWSIDLAVRHLTIEVRVWNGGEYVPCPDLGSELSVAEYDALDLGQREDWVRYHGIPTTANIAAAINRARLFVVHEEQRARVGL